jgi:D-glycero-alpha-D-manno-heptose-7-phosphate kinase
MIISKTPLRISFFGGGTDYPDYVKNHGGAVLSTSIDKYVYLTVNKISEISPYKYKLTYSKLEQCQSIDDLVHPSVRECLRHMQIQEGIEIHTVSDLPAQTGLGSSSSFTVGLLNALNAYKGKLIPSIKLALEAIYVEQKLIKEKVGFQDQCAAAVGGLNYFEFWQDGTISYKPVIMTKERKAEFKQNLMLFYTGMQRFAEDVLKEQIDKTQKGEVTKDLSQIRQMVDHGFSILTSDADLSAFGELLHEAWMSKKKLSSAISSSYLDDMYTTAKNAGAIGGKLLGAGGGGFFLFYVEKEKQQSVRSALKKYQEVSFDFDKDGSKNIFVYDN